MHAMARGVKWVMAAGAVILLSAWDSGAQTVDPPDTAPNATGRASITVRSTVHTPDGPVVDRGVVPECPIKVFYADSPLTGAPIAEGVTGPNGQIEFESLPFARLIVVAARPGYGYTERLLDTTRGATYGVGLMLQGGGELVGRIVRGGNPVPGASISLVHLAHARVREDHPEILGYRNIARSTQTDPQGNFAVLGFRPGPVRVETALQTPEGRFASSQRVLLSNGETQEVTIELPGGPATLAGKVICTDGLPEPESGTVTYITMTPDGAIQTVEIPLPQGGAFRFDRLPPGPAYVSVRISHADGSPITALQALTLSEDDPQSVTFTLAPGITVSGQVDAVCEADGHAILAVQGHPQITDAIMESIDTLLPLVVGRTDIVQGSFSLTHLAPGPYTLLVLAMAYKDGDPRDAYVKIGHYATLPITVGTTDLDVGKIRPERYARPAEWAWHGKW